MDKTPLIFDRLIFNVFQYEAETRVYLDFSPPVVRYWVFHSIKAKTPSLYWDNGQLDRIIDADCIAVLVALVILVMDFDEL